MLDLELAEDADLCGIYGLSAAIGPAVPRCGPATPWPPSRSMGTDDEGEYHEDWMTLVCAAVDPRPLERPSADPERGRQHLVACNGEIYNYRESATPPAAGHRFRTHSDSEVLLHLYGEYATISYRSSTDVSRWRCDRKRRRLLVGRDRLGISRLLSDTGAELLFASRGQAILAATAQARTVATREDLPVGTCGSALDLQGKPEASAGILLVKRAGKGHHAY